ncbi:MAG: group II intron reverse transcriptase/maturase [Blastocatellia bacterium]|nr:group II intron reverse transcriptase/maturase [Blastocatellia bacterium]
MKERTTVQTSLLGIAKKAKTEKRYRFRNLYRELDEEMLRDSWRLIRKDAALGVDRVSAAEYEANLEENIHQLVERLKRKSYRAKLVRRQYIPKDAGKLRPLGILATEDKLLQLAGKRLLEAIYEQDLLPCSYGYRPRMGALAAVDQLTVKLQFGRYRYVVEADIKGFFDNLSHEWLMRMLAERIDDQAILRLIKKWLKAGVLDTDGKVIRPEGGTPQGGIISPLLANVYLHYALDLWFVKVFRKSCRGEAFLIRFADDFVCGFEREEDAQHCYRELEERLRKFGLELAAAKTRVIPFSRYRRGKTSFEFLGFEFRWGKDRQGRERLQRRTARKKFRGSLKRAAEWCKKNRHQRMGEQFKRLNAKLRGYYNYYGVNGNYASLNEFYHQLKRLHLKWLNRRSQCPSYTWDGYLALTQHFALARPHIVGRPKSCLVASRC